MAANCLSSAKITIIDGTPLKFPKSNFEELRYHAEKEKFDDNGDNFYNSNLLFIPENVGKILTKLILNNLREDTFIKSSKIIVLRRMLQLKDIN